MEKPVWDGLGRSGIHWHSIFWSLTSLVGARGVDNCTTLYAGDWLRSGGAYVGVDREKKFIIHNNPHLQVYISYLDIFSEFYRSFSATWTCIPISKSVITCHSWSKPIIRIYARCTRVIVHLRLGFHWQWGFNHYSVATSSGICWEEAIIMGV